MHHKAEPRVDNHHGSAREIRDTRQAIDVAVQTCDFHTADSLMGARAERCAILSMFVLIAYRQMEVEFRSTGNGFELSVRGSVLIGD